MVRYLRGSPECYITGPERDNFVWKTFWVGVVIIAHLYLETRLPLDLETRLPLMNLY